MNIEVRIIRYIKELFQDDCSGHDYMHSLRVYRLAMNIAETEKCDRNIVMMSALLHDVDDVKLFKTVDHENARRILLECNVPQEKIDKIIEIIKEISFKGKDSIAPSTVEGPIVQDADRLDAIGAIGIARAFAYGGSVGRPLYDPEIKPVIGMGEKDYRNNKGTTINHFYEKLLMVTDLLNTAAARQIADGRQRFMEEYLAEFYDEWDGEK